MGMGVGRWGRYAVILLVALTLALGVNAAGGQRFGVYKRPKRQGPKLVPGEVIVKFKAGADNAAIKAVHGRHGTEEIYTSPFAGFKRVRIPKGKAVADAAKALRQEAAVEYAEPNSICHAHGIPNDPYYIDQWHLDIPWEKEKLEWHGANGGGINVEPAWDSTTGAGVIVAVLDSGVAYEDYGTKYKLAPDLADTDFVPGYDFVNNDSHPNDDNSHGTHVTGTIAQSTNNGIGCAGVAYNCSIMPVKVLSKRGSGTADALADGIYFAANNGAHVINMSLGWPVGYNPGATVADAVSYAHNKGVTIVCSSGNEGAGAVAYPAAYPECIAVGATRYDETRSWYSNYGSDLDIVAPGGDLTQNQDGDLYNDGVLQQTFDPFTKKPADFGYWFFDGTSMAAPHVSGVAALVIAKLGVADPVRVRDILQSTAEDKGDGGWDAETGFGIVDAAAAVAAAVPVNQPPVVTIDAPEHGAVFPSGTEISFAGSALDNEDGDRTSTLVWECDGVPIPGGTGGSFEATLLDGVHVITATATDLQDETGSASVTITVELFNLYGVDWGNNYRWRDIAENTYSTSAEVRGYTYAGADGASLEVHVTSPAETFQGTLVASGLKPNFAYQVKLNGKPTRPAGCPGVWQNGDEASNETLGYLGRWWFRQISKTAPYNVVVERNATDSEYNSAKAIGFEDSAYWYFFEGYLLFDYFITDKNGDAAMPFALNSSFHVLYKTDQRARTSNDSTVTLCPLVGDSASPDYSFLAPWYDGEPGDYDTTDRDGGTIGIYAEWEPYRPTPGNVVMPDGLYDVRIFLTEESFHAPGGDGGYWQTVMTQDNVLFTVEKPPTANFYGEPTSGGAPLTVQFTDVSMGTPTSWSWDFGDGGTSTEQNPSYTYDNPGLYTVELTASNSLGSDTMTRTDYIDVSEVVTPTMHADSVVVTTRTAGPNYFATATVQVVYQSGGPVEGATVEVTWSEAVEGVGTGITDASGIATVSAPKTRAPAGSRYVATVTGVTKDPAVWDGVRTSGEAPVP